MRDPTIREATPDDAEPLAAVYRSAYAETRRLGFPMKAESATPDEVTEWIESNCLLVATVDGEIVGGVRLDRRDEDRTKLSRLAVHEEWKGEGIGGDLVDCAEETVRESGCGTIRLTTPPDHPYLVEFYRDRGYEVTGEYPLQYRDYDEVVMEKSLG